MNSDCLNVREVWPKEAEGVFEGFEVVGRTGENVPFRGRARVSVSRGLEVSESVVVIDSDSV